MSAWAVGPFRVLRCRHHATQDVLASGNGFQMVGVDAVPHPTEMVYLLTIRDGALVHFIRHPLGKGHLGVPIAHAISLATYRQNQLPTAASRALVSLFNPITNMLFH